MDALGIKPVTAHPLPMSVGKSAPALPKAPATVPALPLPGAGDTQHFDVVKAEQKRYETVRQMAKAVANVYVVSDRTFSLFKDASGQYITRFTSLRDGRVTYIPEPDLAKMSGSGGEASMVSIKA